MLRANNRLKKQNDIDNVFKHGKTFKEGLIVLKVVPNKKDFSRFAFIVSTKISKKAVVRYKIKRQIREAVRLRFEKLKNGYDGIFIVLPGLEKKLFKEIEAIIDKVIRKANLFE